MISLRLIGSSESRSRASSADSSSMGTDLDLRGPRVVAGAVCVAGVLDVLYAEPSVDHLALDLDEHAGHQLGIQKAGHVHVRRLAARRLRAEPWGADHPVLDVDRVRDLRRDLTITQHDELAVLDRPVRADLAKVPCDRLARRAVGRVPADHLLV